MALEEEHREWYDVRRMVNKHDSCRAFEDLRKAVKKGAKPVGTDVGWPHGHGRYGERSCQTIERIDRTLRNCADSIRELKSIATPWRMLTGSEPGQLGWSAVITSKTLHFLCRSLGFSQNPPVAIDGLVIRDRVWPAFHNRVSVGKRLDNWQGNSFEAYCRYMTAILIWASQRNWTTTEMETTIFDQFE